MLQIKTIRNRLDNPTLFDDEVNTALRDGWTLKKRTVLRVRLLSHNVVCGVGKGGR